MSVSSADTARDLSLSEVLLGMPRLSRSEWALLSWTVRWLVLVRFAVLLMTAVSALVGVLLAAADGAFHLDRALALVLGLGTAHASNNLINDWVDWRSGLDRDNYYRRQYGTHALEQGFISQWAYFLVILATGGVALLAGAYLALVVGQGVVWLMLAGAFFVLFYTWPLKHFALGEVAVLLVWGPLMVMGSYFVMTGSATPAVVILSLVYGIAPTLVIFGKHIDKSAQDGERGVQTLPVVTGELYARWICRALLAVQWLLLAGLLVASGSYIWLLACLASAPAAIALLRMLRSPRPENCPEDYPARIWPLWFSAAAFRYSRDFGALLLLGLLLHLVV